VYARPPLRARSGRLGRGGLLAILALLFGPAALLIVAHAFPVIDPLFESLQFHVVVVSGIAGCALVVATIAAIAATKERRPAPLLLALGCLGVGCLLLAHGLTTPGMIGQPLNMWVARLPTLAIVVFAACLGGALRAKSIVGRIVERAPVWSLVVPGALIASFSAWVTIDPLALGGIGPLPGEEQVRGAALGLSGFALLLIGARYWSRWRLGRDRVELSLAIASWLAMSSTLSLIFAQLWRLSWWDYHVYLLAGFASAAWAILSRSRRTRSLAGGVAGISVRDPLQQVASGHPEALQALIGAVEAKDPYTRGHSERVAELSTRIGMRVGLEPEVLRALHQGATLHDVGKIGVPDQILNKPGALDEDEWEWILRHPLVGWELASRAPSLRHSLGAIRHHHERWDGSGYPDRLEGANIPLAGRIVAVADVWDALTSDRAYRPAWQVDRAASHLATAAGSLFDPLCIEAFCDVLRDQGIVPESAEKDLEEIIKGSNAFHAAADRNARTMTRRTGVAAASIHTSRADAQTPASEDAEAD
jgi:hypothetical protein